MRSLPVVLILLASLLPAAAPAAAPPAPPPPPAIPELPGGSLVIVGGGSTPPAVVRRFVELAGGPDALIAVLPTALRPVPETVRFVDTLRRAGARNVRVLHAYARGDVEGREHLGVLRAARGVWFCGGKQYLYAEAYRGTRAESLFHDVLRRGGVIGGTSAGATIQGDYLVGGRDRLRPGGRGPGYPKALNLLPGTAIDQHFSQRRRFADMTRLVARFPRLLGVGVDERTALVVRGHVGEVMGEGRCHFYDRARPVRPGRPDYESVGAGGRYDLKGRRVLSRGR